MNTRWQKASRLPGTLPYIANMYPWSNLYPRYDTMLYSNESLVWDLCCPVSLSQVEKFIFTSTSNLESNDL